jgi:hypothetical protein
MTMPFERTWAVLNTREFLLNLLDPKMHSEIIDIDLLRDLKASTERLKLLPCK